MCDAHKELRSKHIRGHLIALWLQQSDRGVCDAHKELRSKHIRGHLMKRLREQTAVMCVCVCV